MTLFKFARLSRKSKPVVATDTSLDSWCHQSHTKSSQFVRKVEMCTAVCAGEDAWALPVGEDHHHTLLRVSLAPTHTSSSVDTLLIERVLSTTGAHHSVTPITDARPTGGTLLHPEVHDRVCAISCGSSTAVAHHLQVERTLTFGTRDSDSVPRLTLAHLTRILAFISRTTQMIMTCDGGDCTFQSRAFVFTCLAALAPTLPPRKVGEGLGAIIECGEGMVHDSVFELSAEAFLVQIPWLVRDPASVHAVRCVRRAGTSDYLRESLQLDLIGILKDEPRDKTRTRLYH